MGGRSYAQPNSTIQPLLLALHASLSYLAFYLNQIASLSVFTHLKFSICRPIYHHWFYTNSLFYICSFFFKGNNFVSLLQVKLYYNTISFEYN